VKPPQVLGLEITGALGKDLVAVVVVVVVLVDPNKLPRVIAILGLLVAEQDLVLVKPLFLLVLLLVNRLVSMDEIDEVFPTELEELLEDVVVVVVVVVLPLPELAVEEVVVVPVLPRVDSPELMVMGNGFDLA